MLTKVPIFPDEVSRKKLIQYIWCLLSQPQLNGGFMLHWMGVSPTISSVHDRLIS